MYTWCKAQNNIRAVATTALATLVLTACSQITTVNSRSLTEVHQGIKAPKGTPKVTEDVDGLLVDSEIAPLNNLNFDSSTRSNLVALNVVNARAKYLAATSILETAALDPYTFVRDSYIKRRRRLINAGSP